MQVKQILYKIKFVKQNTMNLILDWNLKKKNRFLNI